MKVYFVLAMLAASALAAPNNLNSQVENDSTVDKMIKYFGSCAENDDITSCLTIKGISALNRAARAQNIQIASGVSLTRDPSASARSGKSLTENEIVSQLEANNEDKSGQLYNMFLESLSNFFGNHNLVVKIPTETTAEIGRAIEEGRKKLKKKMIAPLLLGLGAKMVAVLPLFVVGLALLSFKALIVGKIALLLALFLSFSKGLGSGGSGLGLLGKVAGGGLGGGLLGGLGGGSSSSSGASSGGYAGGSSGWSTSGSGGNAGYPYARSYDEAQDLAYNAHSTSD